MTWVHEMLKIGSTNTWHNDILPKQSNLMEHKKAHTVITSMTIKNTEKMLSRYQDLAFVERCMDVQIGKHCIMEQFWEVA
jgi:hypothetical protein